ncbi:unnamed protein product [Closterium sp. NIES-54]
MQRCAIVAHVVLAKLTLVVVSRGRLGRLGADVGTWSTWCLCCAGDEAQHANQLRAPMKQWVTEHPSRPASPRPVNNEGGADVGVEVGDQVGSSAGGTSRQRVVFRTADGEVGGVQARGLQSSVATHPSQGNVDGCRGSVTPALATHMTAEGIATTYVYFKFPSDKVSVSRHDLLMWKESIEPQLEMAGLMCFADGSMETPPASNAELRAEFRTVQLPTFTVISRCCSPLVQIALKSCRSHLDAGHQAWQFIASTYQVTDDLYIGQLEEQMAHLRMGKQEMATDYCNRARRLLACMQMASVEYSMASYVTHVIKGLPSSYNLMKWMSMVPGTQELLNNDSLTSFILRDEAMQEAKRTSELLPHANYVALTKQGGRPGQCGKPGVGVDDGHDGGGGSAGDSPGEEFVDSQVAGETCPCRRRHHHELGEARGRHRLGHPAVYQHQLSVCLVVGGKLVRHTFPDKGSNADDALAVVHINLSGPFRVAAKDGSLYYLLLKDRKTRYVWVRPVAKKFSVLREFEKWLVVVEWHTKKSVLMLRSDRGGEFLGRQFTDFVDGKGIVYDLTFSYTLQQNGMAEREMRTVVESVRTMLLHMGVQHHCGDEGSSGASPVAPAKSIASGRRDVKQVGVGEKSTPTGEQQAEEVQPNCVNLVKEESAKKPPTKEQPTVKPTKEQSATGQKAREPLTGEKSAGTPTVVQQAEEGGGDGVDVGEQSRGAESTDNDVVGVVVEEPEPWHSGRLRRPPQFLTYQVCLPLPGFTTLHDNVDNEPPYNDAKDDVDLPELDPDMHTELEHRWDIATMRVKEALARWKGKAVKAAMDEDIRSLIGMGT